MEQGEREYSGDQDPPRITREHQRGSRKLAATCDAPLITSTGGVFVNRGRLEVLRLEYRDWLLVVERA